MRGFLTLQVRNPGPTYILRATPYSGTDISSGLGDHLDLDFGEPGLLFSNPIGMDATDTYSIDSAMESFLAEFVRGDWGWDPFSGTTAL